jgi:antitoxin ParD1/3/4
MMEQGDFIDPSEAVFVLMGQAKEIEPHQDLKQEVFRRCIAQRIEEAEKGHFYSAEEVWERLDKMIKETTDPVIWQKIVQPDPVLEALLQILLIDLVICARCKIRLLIG